MLKQLVAVCGAAALVAGCASTESSPSRNVQNQALTGAAIGAAVGGGVGAYKGCREDGGCGAQHANRRQYYDERAGRYYYYDPSSRRYYWENGEPRY